MTVSNPDTEAPTVTIAAPVAALSSTVTGTLYISGQATDNVGVVRVELYAGATLVSTVDQSAFSFAYDTTQVPEGPLTLTVRAYDAANNSGEDAITVTIKHPDLEAPTVTIKSPADGSTVKRTARILASATDNAGVVKMQVYADGSLIYQTSSSRVKYRWRPALGTHQITVKAVDEAGNEGAQTIQVTRRK